MLAKNAKGTVRIFQVTMNKELCESCNTVPQDIIMIRTEKINPKMSLTFITVIFLLTFRRYISIWGKRSRKPENTNCDCFLWDTSLRK